MNVSMFSDDSDLKVELNERIRSDGINYFVLTMANDKDSFTLFVDNITTVEMLSKEITKFLVNR